MAHLEHHRCQVTKDHHFENQECKESWHQMLNNYKQRPYLMFNNLSNIYQNTFDFLFNNPYHSIGEITQEYGKWGFSERNNTHNDMISKNEKIKDNTNNINHTSVSQLVVG